MRYLWSIPICILFLVSLTACQTSNSTPLVQENIELQSVTSEVTPENAQPSAPTLIPEDTIMNSPTAPDEAAQKMVDLAKGYLAQRLGISSVEQITLLEMKSVVWQDASLGCPKPSIDYIRTETPGYNIVLEVGGNTYNVHTDRANRAVTCNKP